MAAAERRAAIYRYLLLAGPTAANPQQRVRRANGTDRQMDGHRTVTYTSSAFFVSCGSISCVMLHSLTYYPVSLHCSIVKYFIFYFKLM